MAINDKEKHLLRRSHPIKVMAVDDSTTMLELISAHLKGSKFEVVTTASSGPEAVTKYIEHRPKIVLLDMVMPEMDGSQTLKRLLETNRSLCVIMISSIGTHSAEHECLRLGAKSILQKPLKKAEVIDVLEKVCEEAGVAL